MVLFLRLRKFVFWDICGSDRYNAVINSFYRGSDVAIFVYDTSDGESFENLSKWIQYFEKTPNQPHLKIILGNKAELYPPAVSVSVASDFAEKHKMPLFLISAKDGTNVQEAFTQVAELLNDKTPDFTEIQLVEDDFQDLHPPPSWPWSLCCSSVSWCGRSSK